MRKMRLFNLTDVETPTLKERGHVNITVTGRGYALAPGASCEILVPPDGVQAIQHAVAAGLLSVDNLPAHYMIQKQKMNPTRRR